MMSSDSVTVCVCTRNRPDELSRCLRSLGESSSPIAQVVVSDDSTDRRTAELVPSSFPGVNYVDGPRRGLGANRNCAIAAATGDYILFLDDDACLGPTFLANALRAMKLREARGEEAIVSGREDNRGVLVRAHDQNFLGFQNVPYEATDCLKTIVINATLFPRSLFQKISFDEQLIYGFDEVDIALKAVSCGYKISHCDEAINHHYPSTINRSYYSPYTNASRLYVTMKRYATHEKKPFKAVAFLVYSCLHCAATGLRKGGLRGFLDAWRATRTALCYWAGRQALRDAKRSAPST
jgi:GT2 family glycosyltransferase